MRNDFCIEFWTFDWVFISSYQPGHEELNKPKCKNKTTRTQINIHTLKHTLHYILLIHINRKRIVLNTIVPPVVTHRYMRYDGPPKWQKKKSNEENKMNVRVVCMYVCMYSYGGCRVCWFVHYFIFIFSFCGNSFFALVFFAFWSVQNIIFFFGRLFIGASATTTIFTTMKAISLHLSVEIFYGTTYVRVCNFYICGGPYKIFMIMCGLFPLVSL